MIEFNLPFPPSTNNLFINLRGRGRVKSPEYRKWRDQARLWLVAQGAGEFKGQAHVSIDLDDKERGDCDNRAKPVLDILVDHGILQGDSKKHVRRVSVGWEKLDGCRVTIRPAA